VLPRRLALDLAAKAGTVNRRRLRCGSQKIDAVVDDGSVFSSHDSHPWTGVSFSEGSPDQMV
jgi:hypothetical protein